MRQVPGSLSNLVLESKEAYGIHRLLRSLHFEVMHMRESKIPQAHANTFEWIFDQTSERFKNPLKLVDWLHKDSDVYWVMGKAGSGKSTLMKYLAAQPMTTTALKRWAGRKQLLTAKYFLWNAGTPMEKSQEGLLQTLLYEILRQCPEMIPTVCARRWYAHDLLGDTMPPWDKTELLECFQELTLQAESITKFCFFVDGLDEYDGDCDDLVRALRCMSRSPFIKICASSRPWFDFTDAFRKSPSRMLKLEDHTREDISLYVKDRIESHDRSTQLLNLGDESFQNLIEPIVSKAKGVFL